MTQSPKQLQLALLTMEFSRYGENTIFVLVILFTCTSVSHKLQKASQGYIDLIHIMVELHIVFIIFETFSKFFRIGLIYMFLNAWCKDRMEQTCAILWYFYM